MPKLLPLILVGGLPKSGKTSFINRITPQITGVKVFNEENYVNQVNPRGHDYALDYSENAENLVRQAMVKDVALAAYNRKPVIAMFRCSSLKKYGLRTRYLTSTQKLIMQT